MSGGLARGFLDDIVANIDDDTPRLVYADWLTENGQDARAEFIRVQIERARRPAWDAAQVRLRLREAELLRKYGEAWLAELPKIEGATWQGFRRGIVAAVSFASFEAMRANAHDCRAVAPVEAVNVRWPRRAEASKAASPIAELRELSLTGRPYSENEIAWLAESPQLATLRVLTMRGLWANGLGRLVASPHLGSLKALRLPTNNLGNDGIRALIQAADLSSVEELDLSGLGGLERYTEDPVVQSAGLAALAGWPGLGRLRSLTLSGNDVGRAGLRAFLRSSHVGALKELSLRNGRLDGQVMGELSDARAELRLEVLDLGENVLKELGVAYVASARCLGELKLLRLDRCEVPLGGARALAKAGFLDGLRVLDISHNHFGPVGLTTLLERDPKSLRTLRLRDNDLFDKGAALLANAPASDGLLELDLSQNGLTAAATLALSETPHLHQLLVLRLIDNSISEQATAALAASPLGQRLAVLELVETLPQPEELDEQLGEYEPPQFGEGDLPF